MFNWFAKPQVEDVVGNDMASARALLPSLRLKLDKEGVSAARAYGEGVASVARALARSLGRGVSEVLDGRTLDAAVIAAVSRDIAASQERCREHLRSDREATRELADKLAFGCLVFSHLYRMRLHALTAPEERRAEASALADTYANLAGVLWQIGAEAPATIR
jgi:hypothetical protein